jgi:ribosomal protein S18 acetylase RimI-like enzyme
VLPESEQVMVAPHDRRGSSEVEQLPADRAEEAVTVLCDSFHDYPVMRYVIGEIGDEYAKRLHTLIEFFVAARFSRGEPVLAAFDNQRAVAVALVTLPGERESPAVLMDHREAVWQELGAAARGRYESMGESWQEFAIAEPHFHLNMIGVSRAYSGRGLGRLLLDAVHEMSLRDPDSAGVSLTTEIETNVGLYLHFGYDLVGHVEADNAPDTWVFFRRDTKSV